MTFEAFLEKYYDELYIYYMESGAYYDVNRESFDEQQYEDFLQGKGIWQSKRNEHST